MAILKNLANVEYHFDLIFQIFTCRWAPNDSVLFSWSSTGDTWSDGSFTILRFISDVILVADVDKPSNDWLLFVVGDRGGGVNRLSFARPGDKILIENKNPIYKIIHWSIYKKR